jgi:hypothetical protein
MHTGLLLASLICFVLAIAVGVVVAVVLTEMDNNLYEGSVSHLPDRRFRSQTQFTQQQPGKDKRRKNRRHFHYHH